MTRLKNQSWLDWTAWVINQSTLLNQQSGWTTFPSLGPRDLLFAFTSQLRIAVICIQRGPGTHTHVAEYRNVSYSCALGLELESVRCDVWRVACGVRCVTCDESHVTCLEWSSAATQGSNTRWSCAPYSVLLSTPPARPMTLACFAISYRRLLRLCCQLVCCSIHF